MTKFVSNKNAETKQIHRLAGIHHGKMISINCYKNAPTFGKKFRVKNKQKINCVTTKKLY